MGKRVIKQTIKNKEVRKKNRIGIGLMAATIALTGVSMPAMDTVGLFSPITAEASSTVHISGDFGYTLNENNEATITSYTGTDLELVIPSEIDGYPVIAVGTGASGGGLSKKSFTSVVIPEGVKVINDYAFAGSSSYKNLANVTLPDSLERIGNYAFQWTSIESIDLPEGLTEIGGYAFNRVDSLKHITIPSTVQTIGEHAFSYSGLESVTISEGLTEIGKYAFSQTKMKHITIPSTVQTIGEQAFSNSGLESVTISEGVQEIGISAFSNSHIKDVTIPSSVHTIGNHAFFSTGMTNVTMEDGVRWIGKDAFSYNELTSLELPNSVIRIGESSFADNNIETLKLSERLYKIPYRAFRNNNIESVVIPKSVIRLEREAFANNGMQEVAILGETVFFEKSGTSLTDQIFLRNGPTLVVYGIAESAVQDYFTKAQGDGMEYVFQKLYDDSLSSTPVIPEEPTEPEPTEPTEPEVPVENPEDVLPEPVEPSDSTANDEGNIQTNELTANILSGGLLLDTVTIEGFGDIYIGAQPETHYAQIVNPLNVQDLRGSQAGWDLSVSATPFTGENGSLPVGSLTLDGVADITSPSAQAEQFPTKALVDRTIIDDGAVLIARAENGKGAGEFDIAFGEDALGLTVDPATASPDKYKSTVTWTLASTPTSESTQ